MTQAQYGSETTGLIYERMWCSGKLKIVRGDKF